jgi:hypothetical protein
MQFHSIPSHFFSFSIFERLNLDKMKSIMGPVCGLSKVLVAAILAKVCIVDAVTYTIELSLDKPWTDGGTSSGTTQYVSVRAYVPGSNSVSYRTMPVRTSTYESEANALGDVVGTVHKIYGSGNQGYVDPYDGPKRTTNYPYALHTNMIAINDNRYAVGNHYPRGFIYDVIYDHFLDFNVPNT